MTLFDIEALVLFYLHLALILQHPRSPNSMLFRCCDLRCLRNRKINIVLGEMGGGGEFFQAAENWILLSSVSIVLSLIVDQALTHEIFFVTVLYDMTNARCLPIK